MTVIPFPASRPLDIAVVGAGISGLAAAWLLSRSHRVTLYEKEGRPGGHANTVDADGAAVDTGFIVYNERNYPNLVALFDRLGVPTRPTEMSFAVSLPDGRWGDGLLEYAGGSLGMLFAQKRNMLRPSFLRMVRDVLRFYREAPRLLGEPDPDSLTLGAFLERGGYSDAFVNRHLLPMAAAIWSAPAETMKAHPAAAFVDFCENHGLLALSGRPQWRTVEGGSREYVRRMVADMGADMGDVVRLDSGITGIRRDERGVRVRDRDGATHRHDHVVIATHADQALALLEDPDDRERALLGAFRYQRNDAILHRDPALMPRRRSVWSSWNYLGDRDAAAVGERDPGAVCVTYWMNRLQPFLPADRDLFVTLNPTHPPADDRILRRFVYEHPIFDLEARRAQRELWTLQGGRATWFCGAWFGAGFHEDGLQAGLAVAEALGGLRRPWSVAAESGRIHLGPQGMRRQPLEAA